MKDTAATSKRQQISSFKFENRGPKAPLVDLKPRLPFDKQMQKTETNKVKIMGLSKTVIDL
jgi:hypothetical protein